MMDQSQIECLQAFYEAHILTEVRVSPCVLLAYDVHLYLKQIREKMREMGKLSGVEIEPATQTALLDQSISLAGVIGGGVPGGMCTH